MPTNFLLQMSYVPSQLWNESVKTFGLELCGEKKLLSIIIIKMINALKFLRRNGRSDIKNKPKFFMESHFSKL